MSKNVQVHVLKEYEIIREMGSGAYGHVWQVRDKKTSQIMALKKVFDAFRNSIDAQRTYREVQVLYKLKHENIIKLDRVMKSKNNKDLYLIFEFMQADLHSVVGTNILEKMHQIYIFYQILKAIYYIHSAQLIHRDLKPSNVLINSECKAKICDFGLVRSLNMQENEQIVLSQEVATKWYRAPELLLGSRSYGKPVDMWSFGCIVAELLSGKPLFAGNSTLNQFEKILQYSGQISRKDIISIDSPVADQLMSQIKIRKKSFRQYFNNVDKDFYELIQGCLQFNPNKRLTAQQALKLSIFNEFQNETLIVMGQAIILGIDDNIRLVTKAYRQRIYDDIDQRYCNMPFKDKINQYRTLSNKKEKDRQRQKSLSSKRRPFSVKKLPSESIPKKRNQTSTNSQKDGFKFMNSPYFSSISHKNSTNSLHSPNKKYQSVVPKIFRKQQVGSQSTKILKKGGKQKLSEIQKRNILKSIGVQKPKKLQKYIK